MPGIPAPLLGETFGVTGSDVPFLTALGDRVIVPIPAQPESTTAATPIVAASSPYTVQVDDIPVSQFAGGTVQPLGTQQIPPLAGITVFPLQAVPFGLREPHWHPNTSELNYCVSGRAQIGVVAPDGNVQTFAVEPGSIAFIPDNWFHYIANISDESLQFLIFFVGPESRVRTINLSQTFDFFPPEVLAASVGVDPERFAALPKRGNVVIAPPVATD